MHYRRMSDDCKRGKTTENRDRPREHLHFLLTWQTMLLLDRMWRLGSARSGFAAQNKGSEWVVVKRENVWKLLKRVSRPLPEMTFTWGCIAGPPTSHDDSASPSGLFRDQRVGYRVGVGTRPAFRWAWGNGIADRGDPDWESGLTSDLPRVQSATVALTVVRCVVDSSRMQQPTGVHSVPICLPQIGVSTSFWSPHYDYPT